MSIFFFALEPDRDNLNSYRDTLNRYSLFLLVC